MIVISDTSPICYLVLIDAVDLLPQLYDRVIIPQAVCLELAASGVPTVLREWINNSNGLIVQSVEIVNDEYLSSLDFGERHAIFLAEKLKADLIILDEKEARKIALESNLTCLLIFYNIELKVEGRKMPLSIKDAQTDALVRQLAALTGESITEAVFQSVKERLERLKPKNTVYSLAQELDAIAQRCSSLPVLDTRSPEKIIGYDERGLPY